MALKKNKNRVTKTQKVNERKFVDSLVNIFDNCSSKCVVDDHAGRRLVVFEGSKGGRKARKKEEILQAVCSAHCSLGR